MDNKEEEKQKEKGGKRGRGRERGNRLTIESVVAAFFGTC